MNYRRQASWGSLGAALATLLLLPGGASGQHFVSPEYGGGGAAIAAGAPEGGFATGGTDIPSFRTPFSAPGGGIYWLSATGADRGLGYRGSYLTAGAKHPMGIDRFGGEWFVEGRGHLSQYGGFFGNLGLERSFRFHKAQLGTSAWLDIDADQFSDYQHTMYQIGVNGYIKTNRHDFNFNGYIPIGTTTYVSAPTPFVGNQIVIPGVDQALTGFEGLWRYRVPRLDFVRGYVEVGGYGYRSNHTDPSPANNIDPFGGVKVRGGFTPLSGVHISGEFNHDDQFKTTGYAQVTILSGGDGAPTSSVRGLEPTIRNDHIVRYNREPETAIDPRTGLPYRVVHVDSTVASGQAVGSGTYEDPYSLLAQADPTQFAQSIAQPFDIIFVRAGINDDINHITGVTLQDNQWLFGDGQSYLIPLTKGRTYELGLNLNGVRPVISNAALPGAPTIQLADNNWVSGFDIQAFGVSPAVLGVNTNNLLFERNLVETQAGAGIVLDTPTTGGLLAFDNNDIDAGGVGISIFNANGITAQLTNNRIGQRFGNGGDGINFTDVGNSNITLVSNEVTSFGGDGFEATTLVNTNVLAAQNLMNGSIGDAFAFNGGANVNAQIVSNDVFNNGGDGVSISNVAGTFTIGTAANGPRQRFFNNGGYAVNASLLGDNGETLVVNVLNNNIAGNFGGVSITSQGNVGAPSIRPVVYASVFNNDIIANFDDGITYNVFNGAVGYLDVADNNINGNGGIGIRTAVGAFYNGFGFVPAGSVTSGVNEFYTNIYRNNILDNGGDQGATDLLQPGGIDDAIVYLGIDDFQGTAGIYGFVNGESVVDYRISTNIIDGLAQLGTPDFELRQNAIQFLFNQTDQTNARINRVAVDNNNISNMGGNGLTLNLYSESQVYLTTNGNRFEGAFLQEGGTESMGIELKTNDTSVLGGYISNDLIRNHTYNGLAIIARDNSRQFVTVENVNFESNGMGGSPLADPLNNSRFEDNLVVRGRDNSTIVFDLLGSTFNTNLNGEDEARTAVDIRNTAGSTARIFATVRNNQFFRSEDIDTESAADPGAIFEMIQVGLPTATMALSLFNNTVNIPGDYAIENRTLGTDFFFEENGATNTGFNQFTDFFGPVSINLPQGTVQSLVSPPNPALRQFRPIGP